MLVFKEYTIASYKKTLHKFGKTEYAVPTTVEVFDFSKNNYEYYKVDEVVNNRKECSKLVAHRRQIFKTFQQKLKGTDLYYKPIPVRYKMNKELGKWYSAKVMVEDPKFNPCEQHWRGFADSNKWEDNAPLHSHNEHYWHTKAAIEKSNIWIDMMKDHMVGEFAKYGQQDQLDEFVTVLLPLYQSRIELKGE